MQKAKKMRQMNDSQIKPINQAKIKVISLIGVLLLVGIDQLIKYFVDLYLKPIGSITVIPKVLSFTYLENDGALFGTMGGQTALMTALAIICSLGIVAVLFFSKIRLSVEFVCISVMLAGGLGNIIDRVFRGYVIDYIEVLFVDFYIFNFADCLVTCCAIIIICYEIYSLAKKKD